MDGAAFDAARARLERGELDVLGELDGWPALRGLGSDCEYRLSATRSLCFSVEARPLRSQYRELGMPLDGIPFRRSEVDPVAPRAGLARSARRGNHGVTRAAALGLARRLPRCRLDAVPTAATVAVDGVGGASGGSVSAARGRL